MSVPQQQKTLFLLEKNTPLVVQTSEVPKPGPNEILIKIESAALNPLEWKMQDLGIFVSSYPFVLGTDAAGTVAALGANVTDFKIGERVGAQGGFTPQTGTFQEYFVAPAAVTIKLPPNVSFDEAATFPICASTAALSLYLPNNDVNSVQLVAPWEEGGKGAYAGKPAVVLGGSSSVGQYVIQFLKLSGFSPIITTVSLHNTELVKSLGATHVVDRKLPASTIISEIAKLAGGPVGLVYDSISEKDTQNLAYDIVAPSGTVAIVTHDVIDPAKKAAKNAKVAFAQGGLAWPQNIAYSPKLVKVLSGLLADGSIKPNVPEVLPGGLNAVQGGIDRLRAGAVSARKLVVHPQETA